MLNTSYSSVFFLMLLAFSSCNAQSKPKHPETKTGPLVGQPNQSPQKAVEQTATDTKQQSGPATGTHTKQQPGPATGTHTVPSTPVSGYDSGYESDSNDELVRKKNQI